MKTQLLRDARAKAKLTQESLADLSGVDQTTISRLETGSDPNPTRRTVERLAKALGIAPSGLRFDSPDQTRTLPAHADKVGHTSLERAS